jgi:hypothetical protein
MAVWPSLDHPDSQPIDNRPQGVITTYALYNVRIYFESIIKQTNLESLWAGSYGQLQGAAGGRRGPQGAAGGRRGPLVVASSCQGPQGTACACGGPYGGVGAAEQCFKMYQKWDLISDSVSKAWPSPTTLHLVEDHP